MKVKFNVGDKVFIAIIVSGSEIRFLEGKVTQVYFVTYSYTKYKASYEVMIKSGERHTIVKESESMNNHPEFIAGTLEDLITNVDFWLKNQSNQIEYFKSQLDKKKGEVE